MAGAVQLVADFEGARAGSCQRTGATRFTVQIRPELDKINPSPWYGFDILSQTQQHVDVTVLYEGAKHRYPPKLSSDGVVWTKLPDHAIKQTAPSSVTFTIPARAGRTMVSAQERISIEDHAKFLRALAEKSEASLTTIGTSVERRPIHMLSSGPTTAGTPLIFILGRQHPPEVSGALGLQHFLSTLYSDEEIAQNFRATHRVQIVSLANPDGVYHGHWRLNKGLVDLNRDWAAFTQPETRAIEKALRKAKQDGFVPSLLLDFHSTRRDVWYTQPDQAGLTPPNFAKKWHDTTEQCLGPETPARAAAINPDLPTAKTWFSTIFNAPAITVEFGDETNRERIKKISHISAHSLMWHLQNTPEEIKFKCPA